MKQFGTILGFELKNFVKNKVFVGTTIFLCVVICVVMFFPRIGEMMSTNEEPSGSEKSVMLVKADDPEYAKAIAGALSATFPESEVKTSADDSETIKDSVRAGAAQCAFVFETPTKFTYYVDNLSLYDQNEQIAAEAVQNVYRATATAKEGVPADKVAEIFGAQIESSSENLGVDQTQSFFYTYIMIFALYMVIILYGQMIATNVASEKSSRAMELLITSVKPTAMMFGKVFSSMIAGFTQLLCVFGSAVICYKINAEYWSDKPMIGSIFNIPGYLLGYMLLFFVLGFAIYAFMYGAVGSTVSKLEDVNTAVMPVTLLFIVAFFVVFYSMMNGDMDSPVITVCSFIPFTSPMAMFTRIALSEVPAWQIALSVIILAASSVAIGVISAKIYRLGVLLYGNRPKLGSIIKTALGKDGSK